MNLFGDWGDKIKSAFENFKKIITGKDAKFNKVVFSDDSSMTIGAIYYFEYDPKYKEKLMEYDKLPLSIMLSPAPTPGNFYGFNIHFLETNDRRDLLENYSYMQNDNLRFDTEGIQARFTNTLCFREYILKSPYLLTPLRRVTKAGVESIINLPSAIVLGGGYENVKRMVKNRRKK